MITAAPNVHIGMDDFVPHLTHINFILLGMGGRARTNHLGDAIKAAGLLLEFHGASHFNSVLGRVMEHLNDAVTQVDINRGVGCLWALNA